MFLSFEMFFNHLIRLQDITTNHLSKQVKSTQSITKFDKKIKKIQKRKTCSDSIKKILLFLSQLTQKINFVCIYYGKQCQPLYSFRFIQTIIIRKSKQNCSHKAIGKYHMLIRHFRKFGNICMYRENIQELIPKLIIELIIEQKSCIEKAFVEMNKQTMSKAKPKTVSKKWPVYKFVQMSYISQNMYLNHAMFVFIFLATQTMLHSILPMLALIPTQSSYLVIVRPFCKLICTQIMKYFEQKFLLILFQHLSIMAISLGLIIILLTTKNEKMIKKALKILPVFHQISIFLIFLQTQTLMIFSNIRQQSQLSSAWAMLLVKTVCVINVTLIIILSLFYKLIYHTYSTIIYNHLCTRFSIAETLVVISVRFFAIFAPYIVWTASNQNQNNINRDTTIQVFYNLGLLGLCLTKLKNQVQHFTYFSATATHIYQYCLTLQFSVLIVSLMSVISQEILIIQNSLYVILSLWFFSIHTLRALKKKQHQQCQLLSFHQISNELLAERFIIQLNDITNLEDSKEQPFILSNLKRVHESSCQNIECFCKNLNYTPTQGICSYDKSIIIQTMDAILQKFKGNVNLILLVSGIKLNVHKIFADTLWKLNKINKNTNKYSYTTEILMEKYILNLKKFLQSKNNQLNIAGSQKCIESDNIVLKLVSMYENMIGLKIQFWNCFTKGNVMHEFFQKKINDQIGLMKQFYLLNKFVLNEFSFNYLLVSLLMGYEKFILLKDKISKQILDRANALRMRNTKAHSFKRERNQKCSVQKWIYSPSSCTFQTVINIDQMGTVVAASKNVQPVFGYKPDALKGVNINKVMPTSMQDEHDYLLSNWAKKCSWANIGVFRSIFCVNKDNVCFSSGIYLKLVQRLDSINIIGSVFKENDKDFMIIDNKGSIVGAGSKFFTLLGSLIVGLPINLICSDAENIRKWSQQPQKIRHKSLFYSTRKCESVIEKYLSRKYAIGNRQKSGSQNIIPQLKQIRERDGEIQGHLIEYEVYPYQVGRILFSVIKIESVQTEANLKKMACISSNIQQSVNKGIQCDTSSSMNALDLDPNFLACNSSTGASSTQSSIQSVQNNLQVIKSLFYEKEKVNDRRVYKTIITIIVFCLLGIIACSVKLYINYKGFDELQELFFADGACSDNLQLSMLIFNQAMTLQRITQQFESQTSSKSINPYSGVVKLNSDIDDIMIYDRYKQQYVHNLVVHQFQTINTQETSLTMTKMFEYQKKLVMWNLEDGSKNQIFTTNLILNFLYLADSVSRETQNIKSIFNDIYINNISNAGQQSQLMESKQNVRQYVQLFYINFPQLQRINSANLQFYLSLSQKTNKRIENFGYAKIAGMIVVLAALLFRIHKHYSHREEQYLQIFSQYKQISFMNVSGLYHYFAKLKTTLKSGNALGMENSTGVSNGQVNISNFNDGKDGPVTTKTVRHEYNSVHIQNKLLQIQNNFDQFNMDLNNKLSVARTRLNIIGKPFKVRIIVFALLLITVGALNVSMMVVEKKILKTSSQMMNDINGLMNSENQMIESYFIFKAYHTNLENKYNEELAKKLLAVVNQTESNFNKVAVHSITLFSEFDANYSEKMIRILTTNICEHTKQILPEQFNQKCVQDESMRLVHSGVIQSMNYFLRQLQESLHHYILLSASNSASDGELIANISTLDVVDKTIIYMFKMYQQTQAQITTSLIIANCSLVPHPAGPATVHPQILQSLNAGHGQSYRQDLLAACQDVEKQSQDDEELRENH